MTLSELKSAMLEGHSNPLMIPDRLLFLEELPKLGSGKPDYKKAKTLAIEAAQ